MGQGADQAVSIVWIVEGSTGQYSDHREWPVCAYPTEELAAEHARLAQTRADELGREYDTYHDIPAGANEWDTRMSSDHNGTRYIHYMIELRDALPRPT